MSVPDEAIIAAARAHYVYVWNSADCDPESASARWDGGEVEGDVMAYHGNHVRHQLEAAAPSIRAQALRDYAQEWEDATHPGDVRNQSHIRLMRDRADQIEKEKP